jgi:hypothetical protein
MHTLLITAALLAASTDPFHGAETDPLAPVSAPSPDYKWGLWNEGANRDWLSLYKDDKEIGVWDKSSKTYHPKKSADSYGPACECPAGKPRGCICGDKCPCGDKCDCPPASGRKITVECSAASREARSERQSARVYTTNLSMPWEGYTRPTAVPIAYSQPAYYQTPTYRYATNYFVPPAQQAPPASSWYAQYGNSAPMMYAYASYHQPAPARRGLFGGRLFGGRSFATAGGAVNCGPSG